jgi:hypothetical protein
VIQQALAGITVILQALIEIGLFEDHTVVDAGDLAVAATGAGQHLAVIGFGATRERGEQVVANRTDIELVQHASGGRCQQANEPIIGQANFLAGVEVVIIDGRLDKSRRLAGGLVDFVVASDELVVNGIPQVREVDAAERPMPIGAVALPPIE